MIMYSDGSTTDFSNHTTRGLYRYDYVNPDIDGILGWIHFASEDMEPFTVTKAGGAVVDYTQSNDFVMLSNTGGGSWTLNLPSPVAQSFRTIQFISDDTTFGANTIILDAGSGFLIDDAQTFTINRKFEAITIFSDGSNWIVTQAKT